ncbi:MAG: hypothetical protein HYX60_07070, partial [Legionella longbeachae]|nr:hypothetical protein [Legionella longbeachae]
MKKTVIATLVFVPTLLLSSCYVTSYPGGSNYSSYTPVYYSGYYSGWGGGWGGGWGRGWRNSS